MIEVTITKDISATNENFITHLNERGFSGRMFVAKGKRGGLYDVWEKIGGGYQVWRSGTMQRIEALVIGALTNDSVVEA